VQPIPISERFARGGNRVCSCIRSELARKCAVRRGESRVFFRSDAQRGSPREARVEPRLADAGRPWLRLPVVLLLAGGALLPPVFGPVHLDLLLPALLATERRVTSARRTHTLHGNVRTRCSPRTCWDTVGSRSDLYMKMSPESVLAQREHSSRKWWTWTTSASWT
jgi:hypothetical protein